MFKFINKIKNKEYSKDSGFSLLELSVAVGIAAIVGAAGIVATTGFIGSAETKKDNYVANAERAIAEAESSSLALGEGGSTGSIGGEDNSAGGESNSGEENETEETPVTPGVPTTVLASNIISTGATLTWGEPETGEVEEYIVTLNGDVQGTEPIPNNVFSYDFINLTVNTDYEAKVFAKSNDGTLSEAGEERFTTIFRPMVATGGDKVYDILQDGTVYRVHEFTTVGESSFVVTNAGETGEVEYLVVAGGGSGGGNSSTNLTSSGGGGGGGVLEGDKNISNGNVLVLVGSGGEASYDRNSGEDSAFDDVTSIGGGGGGSFSNINGASGGSGGGGAGRQVSENAAGGSGISGQGNPGGARLSSISNNRSAGGGGATGSGFNAKSSSGGNGGDGFTSSITGTSNVYGSGGGGGAYGTTRGLGGANAGNGSSNGNGGHATASHGGGGGGGAGTGFTYRGGSGGSGVVIVRYPVGIVN